MKKQKRYTALYERLSHDDELQGGSNSISNQKDFLPFRNIMNEWYAKDTSKKIRSTFRC